MVERAEILNLSEETGRVPFTIFMCHRYQVTPQFIYPPWSLLSPVEQEAWRQAEIAVVLTHKLKEAVVRSTTRTDTPL